MKRSKLHWSDLKHIGTSPMHYQHYLNQEFSATPAMRFGTLVHMMVTGVETHPYKVWSGDRRSKTWRDFTKANPDIDIYTEEDILRAGECAKAVLDDPICGPVFEGVCEQYMEWTRDGVECAGIPDVSPGLGLTRLADLKITPYAVPGRIDYQARKMGWVGQLAWYERGVKENGGTVEEVAIVAVTPKPPFSPILCPLSERTMEIGHRLVGAYMSTYKTCVENDWWPGIESPHIIDLVDEEGPDLFLDGAAI